MDCEGYAYSAGWQLTDEDVSLCHLKDRIRSHTMAEACVMAQCITTHGTSLAVGIYRRQLTTAVAEFTHQVWVVA